MPLGVMPGVPPMKGGRSAPLGVMPGVPPMKGGRSAPLGVMPGVPPMKGGGVRHWVSCLGFHP